MAVLLLVSAVITALVEPRFRTVWPPYARRLVEAVAIASTVVGLIYSPWGRRSGAHFNPAVTITFWWLGKVKRSDALFYTAFQILGAMAGISLAGLMLGSALQEPPVMWIVTQPGASGILVAFIAEFSIAFMLMSTILWIGGKPRLMNLTGLFAGSFVFLCICIEAPLSGFSMNPARSFASAAASGSWKGLWIYLLAPPAGMLAAALLARTLVSRPMACAKLVHDPAMAAFIVDTLRQDNVMTDKYDFIIIGTGAGGGTLAHELAPTGKRILMIERGDYLAREQENWSSEAIFSDNRYKSHETWHDGNGDPFQPGIHYYVGGNTKFYGAVLLRMRERDFSEVLHRDGISPAWPISYRDLAPYYLRAEELYQVHGQRGADPTEPPEDAPYPWPAISHEPRVRELADDLRRLGHHPFPLPLGVKLDERRPQESPCIRCGTCDGFPCLVHAKSDAHVICVTPALQHSNVELLTNAFVERLETSDSGREITGVVVREKALTKTYRANTIVVSCGAINSAALLLRSGNSKHPSGLGNRSDVIGRHYMFHNNSAFVALSKRPNTTVFQKTLGLNDYYWGDKDFEFPLGHIQMLGKTQAAMFKAETHGLVPTRALGEMARHSLDFWLTTEDLPLAHNRVTVERDGIHIAYTSTNLESHRQLTARLRGLLQHIGCDDHLIPRAAYFSQHLPVAGTGHQNGTIRFGSDPATSALNLNCRSHEVDNLYVVDGSFFPSSSAVNPTLTIIANAIRIADHLKTRL